MKRQTIAPQFCKLTDAARTLNVAPKTAAEILAKRGVPIFQFVQGGSRMVAINDVNNLIAASRRQLATEQG